MFVIIYLQLFEWQKIATIGTQFSKQRNLFFINFFSFILVKTIAINIYFKNIFECFVSDKRNGRNHGYRVAFYFLHALVIIALQELFYGIKNFLDILKIYPNMYQKRSYK